MSALRVALVAAVIGSIASCRAGVAKDSPLWLFPADVEVVITVDVAKLRQAPSLVAFARGKSDLAPIASEIGAFAKATGFHPLNDVDSVAMAVSPKGQKGVGFIVRGRHLDEKRLVDYMQTSKKYGELVSTRRGARTLWSSRTEPQSAVIFLDDKTLLVGYQGWAEPMADLADGVAPARAAATNARAVRALAGLSGHAVAGVFLDSIDGLKQRSGAGTDGGPVLRQATWTVDAGQKLVAHVDADFASAADAQAALAWWRKGVVDTPRLSVVKAAADGTKLRMDAQLDVDNELLENLVGLMLEVAFIPNPDFHVEPGGTLPAR